MLSSTGLASEKYPESLGEYQLLQSISHNGRPVYQSMAKGDRYIINIGEYLDLKYQFLYFTSDYHWSITRSISNTALEEMRSERKTYSQLREFPTLLQPFPSASSTIVDSS